MRINISISYKNIVLHHLLSIYHVDHLRENVRNMKGVNICILAHSTMLKRLYYIFYIYKNN